MRPAPKIGPATLIYKVDTTDRVAFLTIDDGGYRDPAMAGVLKRNGVKATMFVTEKYARQDPAFFRGPTEIGLVSKVMDRAAGVGPDTSPVGGSQ
jgi:hypothetical protein